MCMWTEMTTRPSSGWSPWRGRAILGFRAQELRDLERLITSRRSVLLEAWYGYHGDAG